MSYLKHTDENKAVLGGKPFDQAAVAGSSRRALGDVTNQSGFGRGVSARSVAACGGSSRSLRSRDASRSVMDIDAADEGNPLAFAPYAKEISALQRRVEAKHWPSSSYMTHQHDINEKMRSILIDWLVEVHLKFKLMPETLFLTVNLIDRFLVRKLVVRQKLQLVGVTAMLLASKYEEIYAPEVRDFVYITDKAYTRNHILAMESTMLNALQFELTTPTAYVFLNRYLKAAGADAQLKHLAFYYVERTMQEYRMLKYLPSMVAASAINMALRSLHRPAWTPTLAAYSEYSESALRGCILDLQAVLAAGSSSSLQAVRKKYASPKFMQVSEIPLVMMD